MNAWKLATDVHHLDMRNKAPFALDFVGCHLVVQAPGSDGLLRNWSLLQKAGSFTSYSEDIQPWVQFRAHCILPNWSQVQQSGTAGHFTIKLPCILKCKKQENFKWEETAQSWLTGQGSSTNSTQPPTLGKPKNKILTNLCIPTCHLSSPIETLESPVVNSFQLHIIPKWMRGQLYLKYCHAELCAFQLKAKLHKADPVQVPSKLQPSKQDPLQESWNLGVGKKPSSTHPFANSIRFHFYKSGIWIYDDLNGNAWNHWVPECFYLWRY